MVNIEISSNIMKYLSPKCYMTFSDMIIYSDRHFTNRDLVTELDLITVLMLLPYTPVGTPGV